MSLNVNTALYSLYGVDGNNVNKIASKILNKQQSAETPTVKEIDYSKFNRNTLGIDLYSKRTTPDLQKQISLTQAGLYAKSVDVAQLNSSAAANLYSASTVAKNVELTQSININTELTAPKQLEKTQQTVIEAQNIKDKHSSSSNGFNPFSSSEEEAGKKNK